MSLPALDSAALARKSLQYRRRLLEVIKHAGAGHTGGGLGTSLVELVEDVSAIDEIGVAGKGNGCERLRWCFWSF